MPLIIRRLAVLFVLALLGAGTYAFDSEAASVVDMVHSLDDGALDATLEQNPLALPCAFEAHAGCSNCTSVAFCMSYILTSGPSPTTLSSMWLAMFWPPQDLAGRQLKPEPRPPRS